ncbi:kinesin-like protein KIF6 [Harmonia axyridis]|uniref:kinesin-like protein KIF6 n=1 Tax=Harmonia axyridis TaxID=115357 RepID=UPI001E275D90|nr:kinesin-like protein KIF6 [Harmonia axyridis]
MVKNSIKVYARIRKETASKKVKLENYIISRSNKEHEDLIFHHSSDVRFSYYQFRYHKIFDQLSSQKEIFEMVAKPVVNSVINGFNGTIFAYGQTGSGKTYSITGCPKIYENRGIIPRCIEHIFEYLSKNPEAYSIQLSYLEIYNEIGYDLLNPKQMASKLEEFPRVILLEDGKGEAHLRNLSIHAVSTEREAMRLLFLGDTNRTIAETPMNDYSSRSHCIFTIYLTSRLKRNNKTLKSKLHVVDLAGSERIGKSSITGNILNEAKNINLSLHYLEQVITALSVAKKHIPFRNSMLTYILKDSLCGNSLTTMLATLTVTKSNIEETISTCRFSKRVSMITTHPIINEEEFDSQREINILQNEICELKTKLSKYESESKSAYNDRQLLQEKNEVGVNSLSLPCYVTKAEFSYLGKYERDRYRKILDEFLNYKMNVINLTPTEMKHCMEIMREMCLDKVSIRNMVDAVLTEKSDVKNVENKTVMSDKLMIKEVIPSPKKIRDSKSYFNFDSLDVNKILEPKDRPPTATSGFIRNKHTKEIREYHEKLKNAYEKAKSKAEAIEKCRQNIVILRTKMDRRHNLKIGEQLVGELYRQQDIYRRTILELRELEKETSHLKFGLLQCEMRMRRSSSNILDFANVENAIVPPDSSFTTPYDQFSYNSNVVLDDSSSYHYTPEDYNRPEKDDVGIKTLFTAEDLNCLNSLEDSEQAGRTSSSFLELLTDVSGTLGKELLGPMPEKEESSVKNWYTNGCRSHKETNYLSSDLQDLNDIYPVNRVGRFDVVQNQKQKSASIRGNSSKSIGISRKPNSCSTSVPSKTYTTSEQLLDFDYDQNQIGKCSEIQRNLVGVNRKPESKIFPNLLPKESSSAPDRLRDFNYNRDPEWSSNRSAPENNLHKLGKTEEFLKESDSPHFKEFMKSVPLTGDKEVDEEIMSFYRSKFKN